MIPTTQLKGESNRAYEAFKLYTNLGHRRTHAKVAKKLGKSATFISRLASRFKWRERIAATFVEDHDVEVKAKEQVALEAARELERRREVVRQNSWKLYQRFVDASIEHLGLPLRASKPVDASRLAQTASLLGAIGAGEQPSLSPGIPISMPVVPVVFSVDERTLEARRIALASVLAMPESEQRTRMAARLRAQIARAEQALKRNGDGAKPHSLGDAE